ncbi:nucleotidyltransferase family protein [Psychromarinibacter sp. S121]|uniref:nucleotidyltransferase family protein n=1 Tax=Psychromarinibacter sp. S121 TaxID=3415127 RepID=UPI003C7CCDC1
MIPLTILLFAAGSSSRMKGRDKLMERIGDETLLQRSARRAVATGLPVIALLPPEPTPRAAELNGLVETRVTVPDAGDGMSRSIGAGLAALPDTAAGAMMVMADMPDLDTGDLLVLAARFDALDGDSVIRAAGADGTPGSPAVVPRRLFAALMALDGDTGGRDVLKRERQEIVPLPDRHALTDLDTPEDWAEWRARNR